MEIEKLFPSSFKIEEADKFEAKPIDSSILYSIDKDGLRAVYEPGRTKKN